MTKKEALLLALRLDTENFAELSPGIFEDEFGDTLDTNTATITDMEQFMAIHYREYGVVSPGTGSVYLFTSMLPLVDFEDGEFDEYVRAALGMRPSAAPLKYFTLGGIETHI